MIHGRVLDENALPVRGTLLEFWQANASGRYRHRRDGYQAALDPNFGTATSRFGYQVPRTFRMSLGVRF